MSKKPRPRTIWRFQRDPSRGDYITGVVKDRKVFCFCKMDKIWASVFGIETTVYLDAVVTGTPTKPHVKIIRKVDNWEGDP